MRRIVNKFPGQCTECGSRIGTAEGFAVDLGSGWKAFCADHAPTATVTVPAAAPTTASFGLTEEQADVVAAAKAGHTLCVEAFAGAGKTSVLKAVSAALAGRYGLYTAFNAAIVADGRGKFGRHVTVKTFHSLALNGLPGDLAAGFRGKMDTPRMNPATLAGRLGCQAFTCQTPAGRYTVPRSRVAEITGVTVNAWMLRDRSELTAEDVVAPEGLREMLDGDSGTVNWSEFAGIVAQHANTLWADLSHPVTSQMMSRQFVHNAYLKAFAQLGCGFATDFMLVDEAQDLDPVMLRIIQSSAENGTQIILVGDSQQAIYGFRGAVNALATFSALPEVVTLRLTRSFRFGPEIAAVAQIMLDGLGCPARIVGGGAPGVVGPIATPRAVLCRTNAGVITAALESLAYGLRVGVVGGVKDVLAFAEACQELKAGVGTAHLDLQSFTTWGEVQEYVETDAGADLKLLVDLIDKVTPEVVIEDLGRCGDHTTDVDVVVGTTHKTKGLEWSTVQLGADWRPFDSERPYSPEDMRVLYVAATRAKVGLDTGPVFA